MMNTSTIKIQQQNHHQQAQIMDNKSLDNDEHDIIEDCDSSNTSLTVSNENLNEIKKFNFSHIVSASPPAVPQSLCRNYLTKSNTSARVIFILIFGTFNGQ